MNNDEHLDNLLDQALSEYRDAEPLAGMEDRVLRRLQGREPVHTRLWLRWGIAAVGLAALVIAVWAGMARRTPQIAAPAGEVAAQPKTFPQRREFPTPAERPALVSENVHARDAAPRRATPATSTLTHATAATAAVFPVPVPLTDEERAFVAALDRHPEAAKITSESNNALVIAQIEIKPLSTTDENPGDNQ